MCVLFSVVYIKRGGGSKALYIHLYAHTHIYEPQDVCRKITTSTQGNGNDLHAIWRSIRISKRTIKSRGQLTRRHAATSMPTLGASERLYQLISLFTNFYLHTVQKSFIYSTDY